MQLSKLGELTLLLTAMLTIMVGAVLAPGLHSVADGLGVSEYAPLLITLPALGAIVFAPLFGQLIDRIGARKTLLISLWGYFLLGVAGAWVHGITWVVVDRVILGGFAAGAMAAGTAVISQWYQGAARLNMIAKQGMAIELGGVVFLFLGGLLSEWNWHAPFLLYTLGLLCVILTLCCVPTPPAAKAETVTTTAPVKSGGMRPIALMAVLAMGLFYSLFITLPGLLTSIDYSESQTGYVLSFISLIAVFSALVMPKVVNKMGKEMTLVAAFIAYATAHLVFSSASSVFVVAIGAIAAGIGFGLSIPLLNHLTVEISTEQNRGRNLARFAMAVFSGQFVTSVLDFLPMTGRQILVVCAVLALIVAAATFSSSRKQLSSQAA